MTLHDLVDIMFEAVLDNLLVLEPDEVTDIANAMRAFERVAPVVRSVEAN